MKPAITFVSSAPANTSTRLAGRSSGSRPLSATYDWMKAWPHGVIVVPTVPTTASQYAGDVESWGMDHGLRGLYQSGWARKAEIT